MISVLEEVEEVSFVEDRGHKIFLFLSTEFLISSLLIA